MAEGKPSDTCRCMSRRDATPVLEPAKHDFKPVAALVVLVGFLALLSARDAGAYPCAFQCFSEQIDLRQAVQHTPNINTRLNVGLREEGLKTRHLRVAQPEKVRHIHRHFEPRES